MTISTIFFPTGCNRDQLLCGFKVDDPLCLWKAAHV
jgi:hypothetical protein